MSCSPNNTSSSNGSSACACTQILGNSGASAQPEKGVLRTPATNSANANILADTLGVSPLYRQQEYNLV